MYEIHVCIYLYRTNNVANLRNNDYNYNYNDLQ